MKRDLDLIKAMLLSMESDDNPFELSGYTREQIHYHMALLHDAGLIITENYYDTYISPSELVRTRITWVGHEFLDACRSESTWEKAKKIAFEKTGSITFEIVKTVLTQLAKQAISGAP